MANQNWKLNRYVPLSNDPDSILTLVIGPTLRRYKPLYVMNYKRQQTLTYNAYLTTG
jgi:hypothetical protein